MRFATAFLSAALAATATTATAQTVVNEVAELIPPSLDQFDLFGRGIAINERVIAVGAPGDDQGAQDSGAFYIFDGQTYDYRIKVAAPVAESTQDFGREIAVWDNAVYVAARRKQDDLNRFRGAVYLYSDAGIGPFREFLPEPTTEPQANDQFGASLAAGPEVLVVGAPLDSIGEINAGAVYIFRGLDAPLVLRPSDLPNSSLFGIDVALDDDLLLVGASGYRNPEETVGIGAAYLFDVNTGAQLAKIVSPIPPSSLNSAFGRSVAIEGNRLVIGARDASPDGTSFAGQSFSYIYDAPTQTIVPENVLTATPPIVTGRFGTSSATGETLTTITAPAHANGGEAFVYRQGDPSPIARYIPNDTDGLGDFGRNTATDGTRFAIGAPQSDGGGRAFVFRNPIRVLAEPRDFVAVNNDLIQILFGLEGVGPDVQYRWRKDGRFITDVTIFDGFNTEELLFVAGPNTAGVYDCVVTTPTQTIVSEPSIVAVRNDCPADQNFDGRLSPGDFNAWVLNDNLGCNPR
ncbi:MAG: FG-GAP repeat protein [Planctomycetota bacterium]